MGGHHCQRIASHQEKGWEWDHEVVQCDHTCVRICVLRDYNGLMGANDKLDAHQENTHLP